MKEPRHDLQERLASGQQFDTALTEPLLTHWLNDQDYDRALGMMRQLGVTNDKADKVKIIFIPSYLMGDDGVVNLPYYDVVLGHDLCIFPSYYEPWGYTPLEAIAFKVPSGRMRKWGIAVRLLTVWKLFIVQMATIMRWPMRLKTP